MAGRSWAPLAGACWYPIDLLTPAGALTVTRRRATGEETARVEVGAYPYPTQELTVAPSQVDLSAEDLARDAREKAGIEEVWLRPEGPPRFSLPLSPPLEPLPAGGLFGARRVFNRQPRSPHSGADYTAPADTPVRAAAAGTVALTGEHFFAGNSVYLDHGAGLFTMYFHLSKIGVAPGQEVEAGEVIGAVGETGRATGPHLHFAVRWRGARVDPALLLGSPSKVPAL